MVLESTPSSMVDVVFRQTEFVGAISRNDSRQEVLFYRRKRLEVFPSD